MADFVQTMKDWRRMCKAYTTDNDSCCEGCPVVDFHEHGCGAIFEMEDSTDWKRYADTIKAWAAEHPEPVYPTWREWLIKLGIVSFDMDFRALLDTRPTTLANTVKAYINEEGSKPIPADIAQKLGIEPKEG